MSNVDSAREIDSPRIEWRRAARAVRRLVADSERTEEVFELIEALSGSNGERVYEAFSQDPRGRALLLQKPSLLAALGDRDSLRRLPDGSLGRAYARFVDEEGLDADGLVAASEAAERSERAAGPEDADRDWFHTRLRDSHDLWHVLTGYGRDEAGEVSLLAFTYGQLGDRGIGLLVVVGGAIGFLAGNFRWPGYLRRALRRGRAAKGLQFASFEDWLARPLAEVRRECGIAAPEIAHPGGIVSANRGETPVLEARA